MVAVHYETIAVFQLIVGDYVTRLGYGVAAVEVWEACVATGYVAHTFVIPLPEHGSVVTRQYKNNATKCGPRCDLFESLAPVIRHMTDLLRQSIQETVDKAYRLIPETSTATRRPRGVIDGVGHAMSWLFGVSTTSEVEIGRAHV